MELTQNEIGYIGTSDECLHVKTNLIKIAKGNCDFFPGMDYTFTIENAYKRHFILHGKTVKKFVENDEITKHSQGGGFYPTYMCSEGTFAFITGTYRSEYRKEQARKIEKQLGEFLEIVWETDQVLKVRTKDPSKYLIEFDFAPRNNGVFIKIVTRAYMI